MNTGESRSFNPTIQLAKIGCCLPFVWNHREMRSYPELPILPAAPNRRSNRERYGSLFYLGIGGLLILLGLILWFG